MTRRLRQHVTTMRVRDAEGLAYQGKVARYRGAQLAMISQYEAGRTLLSGASSALSGFSKLKAKPSSGYGTIDPRDAGERLPY